MSGLAVIALSQTVAETRYQLIPILIVESLFIITPLLNVTLIVRYSDRAFISAAGQWISRKKLTLFAVLMVSIAAGVAIKCIQNERRLRARNVKKEIYIPKNIDECFAELDRILDKKDIRSLKNCSENELSRYHFGLGQWLRGNWKLWGGSELSDWFLSRGIHHGDDKSAIIINAYWRYLNHYPLKLDEQIAYYQNYWKQQGTEDSFRQSESPPQTTPSE